MVNRDIVKSLIRLKLKELEDLCMANGFPCSLGFTFGRSWNCKMQMNKSGELEFESDDRVSRSYSELTFRVTIEDSDWGDDPKMLKMLEEFIKIMTDQFGKKLLE